MVRLVFRPYTQVRRSICTSESLRTSTRVSSGFVLLRHSSPSFGSQRTCSCSASHSLVIRRARSANKSTSGFIILRCRSICHLHSAFGFRQNPTTRTHAALLGPCFKTGRIGCRQFATNLTRHAGAIHTYTIGGRHALQAVRASRTNYIRAKAGA